MYWQKGSKLQSRPSGVVHHSQSDVKPRTRQVVQKVANKIYVPCHWLKYPCIEWRIYIEMGSKAR